ncbi:hypothetical protein TSAR_009497 [Trichomalopsis sarcophagae]|uniref:Tc1-like transposase DDE domain-containing protein n=1 Tax=Trichomalopsis sarcophagae TaxID=543379 RepID=A0A232EIZ9_9HYME|nr:hypothetical protein TSAR_009497 [Trichomalopsis sarcophagae]
MFSDESTFNSIGHLNRHNSHYWSAINPHGMQQIDNQHRWNINFLCCIMNGNLMGPYFFEGNVNSESYLNLIENELPILLEHVDMNTRYRMWLQQDGAPPHYARIVRNFLNDRFPNRWIGRGGPIAWPRRSLDLTPLDFYLWGYLKDTVYRERPTTANDMRMRIQNACANIPRNVLIRTVEHFQQRLQLCLQVGEATFEHSLP